MTGKANVVMRIPKLLLACLFGSACFELTTGIEAHAQSLSMQPAPATPELHAPFLWAARPGTPLLFTIPASYGAGNAVLFGQAGLATGGAGDAGTGGTGTGANQGGAGTGEANTGGTGTAGNQGAAGTGIPSAEEIEEPNPAGLATRWGRRRKPVSAAERQPCRRGACRDRGARPLPV